MKLHVDRTACDGRGTCVELLPELLHADPWGYPMTHDGNRDPNIDEALTAYARRAATLCPRLAIKLID